MNENITYRNFSGGYGVSEDYIKIHDFLVKCEEIDFSYARFDWMITHRPYLQEQYLGRIGIWEDKGIIVAAALFDTTLDDAFLIALLKYEYLYDEMIEYANAHMINENQSAFRLYINDSNMRLQTAAIEKKFVKTQDNDFTAQYDLSNPIFNKIELKEDFSFASLEENREYKKYLHCLFRGFGHEERNEVFEYSQEDEDEAKRAYERINVDLNLKISVKAPNGAYIAHCGMWYDKNSSFAVIEPVCTDPAYRKQGFGKAVVLEGLRRVQALGAKFAVVGSNQKFYYSIGLTPYTQGTFWIRSED